MYLKFITFPKATKCLGDHTTPPPFNLRQIVNILHLQSGKASRQVRQVLPIEQFQRQKFG